jgi:5S rRNA maturation endonuclease (ribonuclease M5)
MRAESIKRFLMELGADESDITQDRGYVNSFCPLALYQHAGGVDSRPSFGIRVSNEGRSYSYCFGCSAEGKRLDKLLHAVWILSGTYPYEAAAIYATEENHVDIEPEPVVDIWDERERKETLPLSYDVVNKFPLLQGSTGYESERCHFFLEHDRHISVWAQHMLRVRYSPDDSALVFPLTDSGGNIFLLRARSRKKKQIWTISPKTVGLSPETVFPKLRNVGAWFGMWLVDWRKPVMLVEGATDLLRLVTLGHTNIVASMTSSVTDAQIDALCASTLILAFDADKAGEHAHRRIKDRVGTKANVFEADWSASACNDGGDLKNIEELRKVLRTLKPV